MPNLGVSELLVIFTIVILIFGASRLPAMGEGMGKAIRSFKRGMSDDERIEVGSGSKGAPPASSGKASEQASQAKDPAEPTADADVVEKR